MALLARCGIGVINTKGKKGLMDQKLGQDNFSITRLPGGWEAFCVMDGHGGDGHWPSTRAVRTTPYFLSQPDCTKMLEAGKVEAALQHAFLEVERDLEVHARREKIKIFLSGSTASCALWHPNHGLWIGYVGDSRVALVDPAEGSVLQMTQDHKPDVPVERARIMLHGCCLESQEHADGTTEMRIFVKDKPYPGITMTRSLGDTCVKDHGVLAFPEVVNWPMPEASLGRQSPLLIMASDGLWEFISTEEVASMVQRFLAQGLSLQATAEQLSHISRTKWRENEGSYCDDITVLLVPLTGSVLLPLGEGKGVSVCTDRFNDGCIMT